MSQDQDGLTVPLIVGLSSSASTHPELPPTHSPIQGARTFRPDGSVLLAVPQDRLYRLNGIGTMAWEVLADSPSGLSAREIAREMGLTLDQLNREGRYRLEASPERLQADMEEFLESSATRGLLKIEEGFDGEQRFVIADGIYQNAVGTSTALFKADETPECRESKSSARPSAVETLTAILALAACDAILKLAGFARLFAIVQKSKARPGRSVGSQTIERICGAVGHAQVYYPRKALCLQRSAVATLLLRRRGVAAEMVVAAKDFPLAAHAWVEVDGRVVNDEQRVNTRYSVLTRL